MYLQFLSRDVVLTLLVLGASTAGSQVAQTPLSTDLHGITSRKPTITPEFGTYVEKVLKDAGVPGVTIGIVHSGAGDKPEFELGAWGRKTEEGDGHDLTTDSLFCLASVSKAFLASSLGVLMEDFATGRNVTPLPDGLTRFDWDSKVVDVLPGEWKMMDHWTTERASMRDILAHVSGLPRHDYAYGLDDTTGDMVHRLQYLRPAYELREHMSYNNIMFKVGAYIVSKYSNMSYTEFASSRIFAPLNMTTTTFWPDEAGSRLTQRWTKFGRLLPFWFSNDMVELMAGPGGVISSAEDMVKWVATIMNEGVDPLKNETVVPASTWSNMTTSYTVVSGTSAPGDPRESIVGYGMGWFRGAYRGHDIVWHTGAVPGFSTRVLFCPTDGLGMVILANADEKALAVRDISYHIIEKGLGLSDASAVSTEKEEDITRLNDEQQDEKKDLSLELEDYAGTYFNAGYGTVTLCSPSSTSHLCNSVLSDFAPFEHFDSDAPAEPRLYAAFPRIWATHLRLIHQTGDDFGLVMTALFPGGYGQNTSAFETWESGTSEGTAMFIVEKVNGESRVKGFGMTIHDEVLELRKQRGLVGVHALADAWFERV